LESAVEDQKAKLAKLQEQIETVEEKSDSANGRLSAMAPHRQFGTDSIIHGPTWLAKQDPENYVVRLISANDKEKLYQAAQRWGRYLKEDLAFYETSDAGQGKFVLVYGAFSDAASARKAAQRLPTIDPWQRKQVERMISIQGKI
ncbi:MAG: SPOR domain-containing protein, partial [Sedimenticola sp.]